MDSNIIDYIQMIDDFITNNSLPILTGSTAFLFYCALKRYLETKEANEKVPQPVMVEYARVKSVSEKDVCLQKANLSNKRFNKFYQEIKRFNKNLEENFSQEELQNYYNNIRKTRVINTHLLERFLLKKKNIDGLYVPVKKKILIREVDSIYHELFHMASSSDEYHVGFDQGLIGKAINEGYTEIMNRKYFPQKKEMSYLEQVDAAKIIDDIVGNEEMEKLFLKSDLKGLILELSKYISIDDIMKFLAYEDYIVSMTVLDNRQLSNEIRSQIERLVFMARNEVERFLIELIKNKNVITVKENPEKATCNPEDLYLTLKVLNEDQTGINTCQLNKDIKFCLLHDINDISNYSVVNNKYLQDIYYALDFDDIYYGYLDNGFGGFVDLLKEYLTEEDIYELIEDYEFLSKKLYDDSYDEEKALREERTRRKLFIIGMKQIKNIESMSNPNYVLFLVRRKVEDYIDSESLLNINFSNKDFNEIINVAEDIYEDDNNILNVLNSIRNGYSRLVVSKPKEYTK